MTGLTYKLADDPDFDAREAGRLLFAGPVDFVKGVVAMAGLPPLTGWKCALPGARTSASRR